MKLRCQKPIPDNWQDLITQSQMITVKQLENFGWELKFVRRPLFLSPEVVMVNEQMTCVITDDGNHTHHHNLSFREEDQ